MIAHHGFIWISGCQINREEGRGTAARCPQQGKRHGFFALVKEGVARARVATCVLGCVKALNTFGDTSY